jgi:hypothetical protein
MSEFKDLYTKAITYKDMDKAIETLSDNAIYEMIGCMKAVDDTTGLDLKQSALLVMMQTMMKYREDELTASEAAEQAAGC